LGTRREIKNLNSFKFMQQAIDYEVRWQIEQIEDGKTIEQATVLFNPDTGETRAMAARFVQDYGLPEYDATTLTQSKAMASYFEAAAQASSQAKLASNWIMGEVSRRLNSEETGIENAKVGSAALAALIQRISDGTISNNAARQVFDALWNGEGSEVDAVIEAKGLKQMNDSGALEKIIDEVIAANPDNVAQFKAGKDKAFNALVGQIMKASKGKANPAQVNELLRKRLEG
ncbi:MAG: aspartyl-tRNA(Asn)/glutamyl-tRNA(Gln) amidotransferase subunit, partial [Pseudomonadota bacterium]|nr:aspartyl-tRNA(Asn)/glutamyl-tRNA(Gln) amidotransferase subunit [Pseudomonadota bacterium]